MLLLVIYTGFCTNALQISRKSTCIYYIFYSYHPSIIHEVANVHLNEHANHRV
jgi:hypothetical protein